VQPKLPELDYKKITNNVKSLKKQGTRSRNKNAELIKTDTPKLVSMIYILIRKIQKNEKVPNKLKTAINYPIYKKKEPDRTTN